MHRTKDTTICSTQYAHNPHTERTQFSHNPHTQTQNNNMQHTEDNREQDNTTQDTEQNAQPQHRCITDDLHKYSFDFYHEYVCIKNSNTIELYTISKENI